MYQTERRGWTAGGLEQAISEYLLQTGAFHPETGEYRNIDFDYSY